MWHYVSYSLLKSVKILISKNKEICYFTLKIFKLIISFNNSTLVHKKTTRYNNCLVNVIENSYPILIHYILHKIYYNILKLNLIFEICHTY